MHYRTIIVSDLHLGSPDAKHKQLATFLSKHTFDHLILNGDIIDGKYLKFFRGRKPKHTEFLTRIVELADNGCKITYIKGNHDENRYKKLPIARDKVDMKTSIKYRSGDKTYFICHGQQFDSKAPERIEHIGFLAGVFVYRLNRVYNKRRRTQRFKYQSIVSKIKDVGKFIMVGSSNNVYGKIKKVCIDQKVDGFICGHLHHPIDIYIDNFHYLNSGDRVESMTALAETPDHQWSVVYYE